MYKPPYLETEARVYVEWLQSQLVQAETELGRLQMMQTSVAELQTQLENAQSTIELQKMHIAEAKAEKQSLLSGDAKYADAILDRTNRFEKEQERSAELKAALDHARSRIESNSADFTKALQAEQRRISELEGALEGAQARIANLEAALDEAKETIRAEESTIKTENAEFKKTNRNLSDQLAGLAKREKGLQELVDSLQTKLKTAQETIKDDTTKAVSAAERYRVGIIGAVLLAILFIVIFVILKA